jgi:triosephosphate isomerase
LISGNWKMHHNHFEAIQTVQKLAYLLPKDATEDRDVSIHPPFTDLRSIQTLIAADEVSPAFLAKLDVRYVIAGHSERRELFGETDEMVAAKVTAIARHGMTPIICVGETLDEREAGGTEAKVLAQVDAALEGRKADQVAGWVIAYEPIWAIGTGRTATAADAQAVCGSIRARVAERCGESTAAAVRIQYGGSVKAANIAELMAEADIDGALVGGASLDPDEFARIVQYR